MKRIISIFLCVLLCLSFSSAFVSATSFDEDELPGVVIDPDIPYFGLTYSDIKSVALVGSGFRGGTIDLEQVDVMFPNEYYAVTHCPAGANLSFRVVVTGWDDSQWALSSSSFRLNQTCQLDWVNSVQSMNLSFQTGCNLLIEVEFDITDSGYSPTIQITQMDEPAATRDLIIMAPDDWEKVYAYTWEPEALGAFPGTRVWKNGLLYTTRIETDLQNLVLSAPDGEGGYRQTGDILLEDNGKDVTVIINEDSSHTVLYDMLPEGIRKLTAKIPKGRYGAFIDQFDPAAGEPYTIDWLHEYNGLHYTFIRDTTEAVTIACIGDGGAYWDTGEISLEPNGKDMFLDLSDYEIKILYGTDAMTRKITVIPPSSWCSVEVYHDDTDYFGQYPGSSLYPGQEGYVTKIPVDLCDFTLNGRLANGSRQDVDVCLEDNGLDATIIIAEDGTCAVIYANKGDVTGDGKLNLGDVARLYAHVRGSNPLTDPVALLHADFTGEGRINMGDVAKLYAHISAGNSGF